MTVPIGQQRRIFRKLAKGGKTIAEIEAEKKRKRQQNVAKKLKAQKADEFVKKLRENHAATKIQARVRGILNRKKVKKLRLLREKEKLLKLLNQLAAEDRNRKRKRLAAAEDRNRERKELAAEENRLRKELAAISPNRAEFSNAQKKELANLYRRGRKTFRAGLLTDPVRVRVSPPRTSPVRVSPPRTPPLMLRNIHGKERQYKKKVWYDKAVARNKKEIERLKNTICGRSVPRGNSSTLEFTNVRGKVRKYKKKGWFDRAVAKNKAIIQRLKTTVC